MILAESITKIKEIELSSTNQVNKYTEIHTPQYSYEGPNMHNILNNTVGKMSVPTILNIHSLRYPGFYCPDCRKFHVADCDNMVTGIEVAGELAEVICPICEKHYDFEKEIKVLSDDYEVVSGQVFYDGNKVTLSAITQTLRNGPKGIFYDKGSARVTFNLESGYSFTSHTGGEYHNFNRLWKRYNTGKAPAMFNSTYMQYGDDITLRSVVEYKAMQKVREAAQTDMSRIDILKNVRFRKLIENERKVIEKDLMDYIMPRIQERLNYKLDLTVIPHFDFKHEFTRNLKLLNRFSCAECLSMDFLNILEQRRSLDVKLNKISKISNNPALELLINSNIPISKKAKKDIVNSDSGNIYVNILCICRHMKNKDNVSKIISLLKTRSKHQYGSYMYHSKGIKLWIQLRGENYVANAMVKALSGEMRYKQTGLDDITDSEKMIQDIKKVLPETNISDIVEFKNEKQYHDSLNKFVNSDYFVNARLGDLVEERFEMEDEVWSLENKEEDIHIANGPAALILIGQRMNICVGSYSNAVRNRNTRIAYIRKQEDGAEFQACLELEKYVSKEDKSIKYKLVQAKLKFNSPVVKNEEIYQKVTKWCEANDIEIDTHDMRQRGVANPINQQLDELLF